ncbi:MAG TPA: alpha/beta hydrolase, partial [Rubrivivax sp.]|nr:alpha/beta hydrolase [Rubrivivax sp.]
GALARSLAARWTTPTLLMWGEEDRCVDPRGSQAFAAAAPAEIVQQRAWPGLAHEVFNEPEREQVVQRLLEFLRELAPSPSAASPQRSRR